MSQKSVRHQRADSLTPWHPFSFTPPKHWTRISGGAEQARKPKRHSNCNFYICNKQQKYEQWISKDPAEQAVYRNTLTSQKTLSSSWKIKRLQFNNTTKWPTFIDAKDLQENKNSPSPNLKSISSKPDNGNSSETRTLTWIILQKLKN